MTYHLSDSLTTVKGIGPKTATFLREEQQIQTIQDLLLILPLRYLDRRQLVTIDQLPLNTEITFKAEVSQVSSYYKNRKSILRAKLSDETGSIKAMWFNNRFLKNQLQPDQTYFVSGKLTKPGMIVQPTVEAAKEETLHTNRLVPIYTQTLGIKEGTLRRIFKEIIDHLEINPIQDFAQLIETEFFQKLTLTDSFKQLHFPQEIPQVVKARERLAVEELLALIELSQKIKNQWEKEKNHFVLPEIKDELLPDTIPFELTASQTRSIKEIIKDLGNQTPMNRLLIGDVGSGKTIVAGVAAWHLLKQGMSVALVAPTKILASQHFETLAKIFPDLELELLISSSSSKLKKETSQKAKFYVGTHRVINQLTKLKPALIIYDEQHKFGVSHRSQAQELTHQPHLLTMTATPIPRSLMLSIFSHLQLSTIDELPPGRKETKTWLIPQAKKDDSYQWLENKIEQGQKENKPVQAIFVCPFINQSEQEGFEHIASATQKFEELKKYFGKKIKIGLLHGKNSKDEQNQIMDDLKNNRLDVLVTTPVVEVGVDLPAASIIVIENAERFGLASLHQLRGRVGRAGQQGYCLLFTPSKNNERLKKFTQENNGLKLAEFDLSHRGAGDIFGTQQHGFDQLRFADWTNLELITQARQIYQQLQQPQVKWQPWLKTKFDSSQLPLAN